MVGYAQKGFSAALRVAPTVNIPRQFVNDRSVDSLKAGARMGVIMGVIGNYGLTDNFGVFTGAQFNFSSIKPFKEDEGHLNMQYFQIPMGVQVASFDLGGGLYLKGQFGVTIDILTGAKEIKDDERKRVGSDLRPLNASLLAHLGVEYDLLGVGYLDLGLGYYHGLFEVYRNSYRRNVIQDSEVSTRLSQIALHIGFVFR
jgi:hypothetical protein